MIWEWDKNKKVYHVHKPGTKTGFQIDPEKYKELENQKKKDQKSSTATSAPKITQPENQGCGNWQDVDNGPQILDTPKAEPNKPNEGCGQKPNIEPSTNTAHTKDPDLKEIDKQSGCPGMDVAEQKPSVFHTWVGSDGVTRNKGDLSGADVKFKEKNKEHIFKDEEGHIIDTPENRERIIKLVKDPTKYLGPDKHGNWWYGEILSDGTQLWGSSWGDTIGNCGLNLTPIEYNKDTGLCRQAPPKNNKKN